MFAGRSGDGCGGNCDPLADGESGNGAVGSGVGDNGAGDGIEFGSNWRVRALADRIGTRTESAATPGTSTTAARASPANTETEEFKRFIGTAPRGQGGQARNADGNDGPSRR